jgi:hypothetical protein
MSDLEAVTQTVYEVLHDALATTVSNGIHDVVRINGGPSVLAFTDIDGEIWFLSIGNSVHPDTYGTRMLEF